MGWPTQCIFMFEDIFVDLKTGKGHLGLNMVSGFCREVCSDIYLTHFCLKIWLNKKEKLHPSVSYIKNGTS